MDIQDKRRLNEKKFSHYEKLTHGGRRYWLEIKGKHGWKARYVKEVNVMEETLKFYQEVYDDKDVLVEIHEKFPVDSVHKKLGGNN